MRTLLTILILIPFLSFGQGGHKDIYTGNPDSSQRDTYYGTLRAGILQAPTILKLSDFWGNTGNLAVSGGLFYYYNGTAWVTPAGGGGGGISSLTFTRGLTASQNPASSTSTASIDSTYTATRFWAAATFQPLLGYTPENAANKATSFGTINNTLYPTVAAVNTWGNTNFAPISIDGTVKSVTAGTGLSGGTITTTGTISMPNTGTAGTYGSSSTVPVITTDAQGRVSAVTTTTISATPSGSAGGDLSGTYPNPLIGNSTITTSKINATGSPSSSTFYRGDGSWSIPDYSKLIPTGVKTTTYAANPSDLVQLNPNPSSFISTLPDNPADKTLIGFDLVDTLGANTVTVNTQGIDVINRAGGSTSYILSVRSEGVIFQYVSSTHIWLFYAAHFPRGNMIKLGDAAGGILSGTYPNPTIVTGAVSNAMLTNSFVTLNGTSVALGASGTIPDNITNTTSNTTFYPTFVSTAGGNQSLQTASAAITYNPSTGALTTASFVGTLNGNALTATTATNLASITTGTYTPSVNGLTPATIDHADYTLIGGHLLFLDLYFYGPAISSNTILSFTMPNGLTAQTQSVFYANSMSNGAHGNGACITSVGSNTVSVSASGAITGTVTLSPVGFSSTGTKGVATSFQLFVNGTLVLALLVLITEVTIFFNNKNS